jgi:hypothetical protein
VQADTVRMRRVGKLPYDRLTDNTRWQRKPRTLNGVEEAQRETARLYRKSLWREAPSHGRLPVLLVCCHRDPRFRPNPIRSTASVDYRQSPIPSSRMATSSPDAVTTSHSPRAQEAINSLSRYWLFVKGAQSKISAGHKISVYCLLQFTGVHYNMRSIGLPPLRITKSCSTNHPAIRHCSR